MLGDPLSGVNTERALGGLRETPSPAEELGESKPAPQPGSGAGGSALLNETLTAIDVQNTLMESQMQSEATARAAAETARRRLGEADAAYDARMQEAFEATR